MTNRFRIISNVGIYDEVDGRIYSDIRSICRLLNKVNNRADRNADLLWDVLDKIGDEEWVSDLLSLHFCKCIDEELKKIG